MPKPTKLIFLPGAMGSPNFWRPVSDRLVHPAPRRLLGWPGFGATPPDPEVNGLDDLLARVLLEIDQPVALIAHSMGGVIAIRAALEKPDLVTHLVLAVTSGGIDVASLGGQDWRPAYLAANPSLPRWFASCHEDLSPRIPEIEIPTLLLWGGADPISPVSVGERLALLLPHAELHVIPGADHGLANTHADMVAPLIDEHLKKTA